MDRVYISLYEIENGSLSFFVKKFSEILEKFPDAVIHTEYDYESSETSVGVFIEIPQEYTDMVQEAETIYRNLPHGVEDKELVKTQDTPISDEFLEAIRNDPSDDKYILSLDGTTLHRVKSKAEIEELYKPVKAAREAALDNLSMFMQKRDDYIRSKALELRQQL